jgi:hypothetical protein
LAACSFPAPGNPIRPIRNARMAKRPGFHLGEAGAISQVSAGPQGGFCGAGALEIAWLC